MLVRIVHFLLGAALAGGGGWLAWSNRAGAANVFPPSGDMPWLVITGVLGLAAGIVFLVSAVHPRPNRRRRLLEQAEIREAKLGAAESYYSERGAAADRDWRSGDIPAPVTPAPELVRAAAPAPPPPPPPVAAAPVKPVATSARPEAPAPVPFPATATLAPIPAAAEPPPAPAKPQPRVEPPAAPVAQAPAAVQAPAPATAPAAMPAVAPASAPAATPVEPAAPAAADPFAAIRAALGAGQLDEAEKLLNSGRDTAQGLALAELTGLAGDHAAAAGRASNAKWLWRLALKRFGELNAMDAPAAKAVSESLRVAG